MALSNTEANAVNTVGRWLLGQPRPSGTAITHDEARDALALLADKSHRQLMAGLRGEDVHAVWPAAQPATTPGEAWSALPLLLEDLGYMPAASFDDPRVGAALVEACGALRRAAGLLGVYASADG